MSIFGVTAGVERREPRRHGCPGSARHRLWPTLAAFAASVALLNTLLTFENALPGIGVRFGERLSFELCLIVGLVMIRSAWRGMPGRGLRFLLVGAFAVLVLTRYVDVTVTAVFGRPVNLYWDGRHGWDALRLGLEAVSAWHIALGGLAAAAGSLATLAVIDFSFRAIARTASAFDRRVVVAPVALLLVVSIGCWALYEPGTRDTRWFYSLPISPTIARQARLMPAILMGGDRGAALGRSPSFSGNVAALRGADVVLVFAESYGVTTFDDPIKASALREPRAAFLSTITSTGRFVASARVRSPTFAGGSWLAHAALLSGIDTRDPGTYDVLLTSDRPTLVSHFASHGYRTIGWMPGLQKPWPEGSFFRYDRIASVDSMGYAGLDFGYWRIPDQASMALLGEQELAVSADREPRTDLSTSTSTSTSSSSSSSSSASTSASTSASAPSSASASARAFTSASAAATASSSSLSRAADARPRKPRFVVFPTLGTHVPFRPLAPYLSDWSAVTRADAYSPTQLHAALAAPVTWKDAVPAYVDSLRYQFSWLGGFLGRRAPQHMLMIVIGDHQPLAAVSGQDASWDVPIHVISDDPALITHFVRHGFQRGLTPSSGTLSSMSGLTPLLLEIFNDPSG